MSKELYIHTLTQFRDECERKHMDTEVEALEAAISALETDGDMISRQAAIDAVENETKKNGYCIVANVLDALPSAQPEIIRCKDCKYYGIAWLKKDGTDDKRYKNSVCLCGKYAVAHDEDWYCADAERREEWLN